jgi:hypothetical protein
MMSHAGIVLHRKSAKREKRMRHIPALCTALALALTAAPAYAQQIVTIPLGTFTYQRTPQSVLEYELPEFHEAQIPAWQMNQYTKEDLLRLQGYEILFGNPVHTSFIETLMNQPGLTRRITKYVVEVGSGNFQPFFKTDSYGPNTLGAVGGFVWKF